MSTNKKRLYSLEEKTVNSIDAIVKKTGLNKSKTVDKAIEYYLKKVEKEND